MKKIEFQNGYIHAYDGYAAGYVDINKENKYKKSISIVSADIVFDVDKEGKLIGIEFLIYGKKQIDKLRKGIIKK